MRARRLIWLGIGLMLVAGALVWWRTRRAPSTPETPRRTTRPARLDVDAFRAQQTQRLARAKTVEVAAKASPVPAPSPPHGTWPMQGLGPFKSFGQDLISPSCILGPGELCATLASLIRACDAGDARDCLAVGQFLADTPPRPLIASGFFQQACRIGDAAGCARLDELKPPSEIPCEDDPFACGWRAYRSHDQALLDEACSLGVGDACVDLAFRIKDDVARSRTYLEAACQVGNPMACMELGQRLTAGCTPAAERTCYPVDPAQAKAALEIACTAGWEAACTELAKRP